LNNNFCIPPSFPLYCSSKSKANQNKQYHDTNPSTSFPFESRLKNISSSLRASIFVSNNCFHIYRIYLPQFSGNFFYSIYIQWRMILHDEYTSFYTLFLWESSGIFGLKIILTANQMLILASNWYNLAQVGCPSHDQTHSRVLLIFQAP